MDLRPEDLASLKIQLDAERGRRSLARYARLAWSLVEPNPCIWNWHLDAMSEFCTGLFYGQFKNGLITIPPGLTKSLFVSTFFPAWVWIQDPTKRFIAASYAQDLSEKNAKLHRDLVMTDWHRQRWPHVQIDKSSTRKVKLFENTCRGWRFSSSVGGQMTGRHGDYLIFDDLVKAQDAEGRNIVDPAAIQDANNFWFKTMHTRRAAPTETRKLGIMQRLHFEDTAQKCIDSGEYEVLSLPMEFVPETKCVVQLPAIPGVPSSTIEDPRTERGELLCPERFPREIVESDKIALTALTFEAQMQQNPAPASGNIFKRDDMKRWSELPSGLRRIITVDCAFKDSKTSDYVAIQCWGVKNPNYYLIDQTYGRFNVLKTCEKISEMKARHPTAVGTYIEDKANGPAVIQIMRGPVSGINPWPAKGSGMTNMSKISRAEAVAAVFESGNVFLPEDSIAPWIGEYITELCRFPLVRHDDRTDATTMALLILHKPQHRKYIDAIKAMAR